MQAQSRWSAQYNILTVSSEGHWEMPMHSFHLSFSNLFHSSSRLDPFFLHFSCLFPSLSLIYISPSIFILTRLIPPTLPNPPNHPPPPLTVILQYSFLPFISVSVHFAPGRQRIKSSDRQVLVLLLVLSETERCRAPVSV